MQKIDFNSNCDKVLKDFLNEHDRLKKKVFINDKGDMILMCEGNGLFEDLLKYHGYKYERGYQSTWNPENMTLTQQKCFTVELFNDGWIPEDQKDPTDIIMEEFF